MRTNAYENYLQNEILMADPLKLVILLYRGGLDSIAAARRHLEARDIPGRVKAINQAIAIVTELAHSLDHARGGEISAQLLRIYDYILRKLVEGNVRQAGAPLAEAEQLLTTLLEGWQECHSAADTAALPANPAPSVYQEAAEYQPVSYAF